MVFGLIANSDGLIGTGICLQMWTSTMCGCPCPAAGGGVVSFLLGSGSAFEGKNRKEMLMAYGNAIAPQAGAHVIKAFMEYAT